MRDHDGLTEDGWPDPMPDDPQGAADWAATFVLKTLAEALGVTSYAPCDGTETWEGDVAGSVYEILRVARVLNEENEVARHPLLETTDMRSPAERFGCSRVSCDDPLWCLSREMCRLASTACGNCGCEERDHRGLLTCRCPCLPESADARP